jgi:hypothetical protein
MPDVRRDLRATSDALQRDLEALGTLVEEKRGLRLDDARLYELAGQIEEIAERVLTRTTTQKDLTEAAVSSGTSGTIESTRRPAGDILAEWRELERRADGAKPGSAEAAEVAVLLDRVHDEYRAAVETSRST